MVTSRRRAVLRRTGTAAFFRRLRNLIRQPIFVFLTVLGHLVIFGGAALLVHLEGPTNAELGSYLDAVHWAVSTVTTVGAAPPSMTTLEGKLLSMAMMITGCWLFWSYTALFAGALVAPEIRNFEDEVRSLEGSLDALEQELHETGRSPSPSPGGRRPGKR